MDHAFHQNFTVNSSRLTLLFMFVIHAILSNNTSGKIFEDIISRNPALSKEIHVFIADF